MSRKLKDLPASNEDHYLWEDAEKYQQNNTKPFNICATHSKENWTTHIGYIQNKNEVTCKFCSWGTVIPGYMRVINEKIVDLRVSNGI